MVETGAILDRSRNEGVTIMKLHFETSPRTAGTRRMLIGLAAVTGLVCGAGGALAQGQGARSTPAAPPSPPIAPAAPSAVSAPPAPSPLAHRVFALGGGGAASYIFKSSENGREIELRLENNEIVSAKIDGTELPKDQVTRAGDTIFFKDAKGHTVFEHVVARPREASVTITRDPFGSFSAAPMHPRSRAAQVWSGTVPGPDAAAALAADPPKVMLGVTMMEPDASLRGHLGLEPGTSTLVGAVYEDLPADAAGLEPYDIIIAINGQKPADTETVRKVIREKNPGDEIKLTVIHRGKERETTIKLEKFDRERFDESKVRSIAAVMDEDNALMARWLEGAAIAGGQGGVVAVTPDAKNPVSTFFPAQGSGNMQQMLEEARARAEAERARALGYVEQLNQRASQAKTMEERMRRLEELLQKFMDENSDQKDDRDGKGGPGGAGGAGAEPFPEELLPSKGIWAVRNFAA